MSRHTRHADGNIAILKISKYLNAKVKIYKLWSDVHFHCAMAMLCTLVPYICICCDESNSYKQQSTITSTLSHIHIIEKVLIRLLLSGGAALVIKGCKNCKLVLLAAAAVLAALYPLFRVFHCFVQFRIAGEYISQSDRFTPFQPKMNEIMSTNASPICNTLTRA